MSDGDSRGHAFEGLQESSRAEREPRPFLEVRSESGIQYIEPSRWERFRLRWAFRHFQVLPLQLLTSRNRRLVLRLIQESSLTEQTRVEKSEVFGVVETARWQPNEGDTDIALLRAARRKTLSREPTLLREPGLSATDLTDIGALSRTKNAPSVDLQEGYAASWLSQSWLIRGLATPGVKLLCVSLGGAALLLLAVMVENRHRDHTPADLSQPRALTVPQSPGKPKTLPSTIAQSRPSGTPAPAKTAHPADTGSLPSPSALVLRNSAPAAATPQHIQDLEAANMTPDQGTSQTLASDPRPARRITVLPQVRLVYPVASDSRLTGELKLMAWISPDGSVTRVSVLGGDPRLAKAGIRAVSQWRYTPATSARPPLRPADSPPQRAAEITIKFFGQDAVSILPVATVSSTDSRH